MSAEKRVFQAEVSKLLHIVANSLYSEREVFLRELVSNAADACDRLRYLGLTEPALTEGDGAFAIRLAADSEAGTLTVSDNGIGMNRAELDENLGTIARSGTAAFMSSLSGDAGKDASLIGQFGVGFYSAFMVADRVEVLTRRAGEAEAWLWRSDGLGEYEVAPAEKAGRGTIITLHLKEDAKEFLERARLQTVVRTYSDHISIPIMLGEGEEQTTLNQASALWTRPRTEIEENQYKEFYRHSAHAFDEPWLTLHWKAEGVIEYASLLFVPSGKPFDLFHPDRKHRVKLYVRRVFITDDCEGLVPSWLRFLKGVIDCEDLPLNVSRELLQRSPVLARISSAVTKRVLNELAKKAEAEPEAYAGFWDNFGAVLKEGLYGEGQEHKEALLRLARFRSTRGEGLVSLDEYVAAMKDGQEAIYYITGESAEAVAQSPHLEGFRAKGVDVLLLSDPIDDFWIPALFEGYEGKSFKSVTRGGADLDKIEAGEAPEAEGAADDGGAADDAGAGEALSPLLASLKLALGEAVKDVRESARLTDSAVCLIADEGDLDINLQRMLRQHRQLEEAPARVLEINPKHALIRALARMVADGRSDTAMQDAALLLLDQARIIEGDPVPDPRAFAHRLSWFMEKGLAG